MSTFSPLSHKRFRLDIVYGLLGHPELGQHKGRRKAGRPAKESAAEGKRKKRVMTTPDRVDRRSGARRFSTDSKRRRPNPPRGKAHAYPKVRLDCGLDPNRFILIKNLNRHPAWDFQDKKKGSVRQTRNRCQVCRARERNGIKNIGAAPKSRPARSLCVHVISVQGDSAAWPASINGTMMRKCLQSRTEGYQVSVQGVWVCGVRKWENRARTGSERRWGGGCLCWC